MPQSDKNGLIDWRNSHARAIIIEDLAAGIIPLANNECTAEEAWNSWYKNLREFIEEKIVYSQFEQRFKDHRKQITGKKLRSLHEMQAFLHHRRLHPQLTHDHKGQPIFDVHPAKPLLQEDVRMMRHKQLSPMALKATREEYGAFDLQTFRQHIYQEVRCQKFIYFLNVKRAEKLKQHRQSASNLVPGPIAGHANKHKRVHSHSKKNTLLQPPHKRMQTAFEDTMDIA